MAKKATQSTGSTSKTKKTTTTKVRNSPIPKAPAAPARPGVSASPTATVGAPRRITHDEIARKAYEIWKSGRGGTAFENWIRAERELRTQATQSN